MELNLENIQNDLQINYFNNLLLACDKLNINNNKIQKILNDLIHNQNNVENNYNLKLSDKNYNIKLY